MQSSKSPNQPSEILPLKMRLLCIATGSISGLAGMLLFGPLFWLFPSLLILGAVAQPYLLRAGRWIVAIGALILSIYTFLFIAPQILGAVQMMRTIHDPGFLALLSLFLASIILVVWSDAALVLDAKRLQHTRLALERSSPPIRE